MDMVHRRLELRQIFRQEPVHAEEAGAAPAFRA
jgi:hypothetical protein